MTSTPQHSIPEHSIPEHSIPEHRVTIRVAGQRDTDAIAPLLGQLGYALLHTIKASARDVGCFRLEVTTRPERAEALAFYRAAGFDERPLRLITPLEYQAQPDL